MEEKNLSKAHISKSVDNLRAKGFVVLTEDENDRRKRHIELTEKAVEAAKNMLEVHNECKEVVMRYVTDEEKELMNQIMQKMLRSLDVGTSKVSRITLRKYLQIAFTGSIFNGID